MTQQALVSVCIPVYNGEKYVAETIQSVQRQTYANLEIIVQDNASTDATWPILQSLAQQDSRISVERNPENCGMAGNWNVAINRASGDYVMLLSADDLLLPAFVARCLEIFQRQEVDAVSTNHFYLRRGILEKRRLRLVEAVYRDFASLVLLRNPFSINFTLFSRQLVERMRIGQNFFAKSYYTCDYDLWIRLALARGSVTYLAECLGSYRVHETNLSKQARRMSRQTALTVLSHKRALKENCQGAYSITILRFIVRGISDALLYRNMDLRLLGALTRELRRP